MKNTLKISLAALVIFGCSSLTVTSDYDKTYDFASVKTAQYYGWTEGTDAILSPFDKERIEKAFGEEFKSRNITFVKDQESDIIVSLHIVTEERTETTATTTGSYGGYGYGGYYRYGPGYGYGTGYSTTTYSTYDYKVGTLLISVYDTKSKTLVWESAAQGTIEENPEKREASIKYAVKAIMAKYPVKASAK